MRRITFYILISALFVWPSFLMAQMKFKSVGEKKPIYFRLGYTRTKGAFVWYRGQKNPFP